jgi:hypothetical protein
MDTTRNGQRFEDIETCVLRLIREGRTVTVSNKYLPTVLSMASRHLIALGPCTKNQTEVSAFPDRGGALGKRKGATG